MNKQGSFVVLSRKNKTEIFLVKRSDFPVWEVQGGGIEKGETPKETAIRETFEETGFRIKVMRKVAEYTIANKISTHLFEGQVISGKYKPEFEGCEGKWFSVKNLPKDMIEMKKEIISDWLKNGKAIIKKSELATYSIKNIHLFLKHPIWLIRYIFKLR